MFLELLTQRAAPPGGTMEIQKQLFEAQSKRTNYPGVLCRAFAVRKNGKPRLLSIGLFPLAQG